MRTSILAVTATLTLAACGQPQGVGFTYGPGPDGPSTNASVRTSVGLEGYDPAPRHAATSKQMNRSGQPVSASAAARLAVDVAPAPGPGNLEAVAGGKPYFVRQVSIDGMDFAVLEPGSGERASGAEITQAAAVFTGCLATGQTWAFGNAAMAALDCS